MERQNQGEVDVRPFREFGRWVAGVRKDRDLRQLQVAAMLKRAPSNIAHVERGNFLPSKQLRHALAELYGVPLQEMLEHIISTCPPERLAEVQLRLLKDHNLQPTVRGTVISSTESSWTALPAGATLLADTATRGSCSGKEGVGDVSRFRIPVSGMGLSPVVRDGDQIVVDTSLEPVAGDRVVVWSTASDELYYGEVLQRRKQHLYLAPIAEEGEPVGLPLDPEQVVCGVWLDIIQRPREGRPHS